MLKVLAADIGGTNSRFAKFEVEANGEARLVLQTTLDSQAAATFRGLMDSLRKSDFGPALENADCFALAMTGPVRGGKYCRSVSLPWDVDLDRDRASLPSCPAWLLNDFLAQAFATLSPVAREADVVLRGARQEKSVVGVIGAGTGLGKAFLVPDDHGTYVGCPSEGGHETFPPESEQDIELMRFACKSFKTPYVEWEDIVSGRGLSVIHEFLYQKKLEPREISTRFAEFPKTLDYFGHCYGRVCRDFAIGTLPFGGLYIAGGIAAKNPQLVFGSAFRDAFVASKSYSEVLKEIPVWLFDNEDSGLWGAAWYGRERLKGATRNGG